MAVCGLSVVAESGDCSPAAVCGLLTAVASLVLEQGLQGTQASVVVAHELSCKWGLPYQASNPCLLHWQADSLPLNHRGRPLSLSNLLC